MQFNTSYLNRTPNKTPRNTRNFKPEFVVMHETAGYGSLNWCLRREVAASFNYLITRSGAIYHYVDERTNIAWHAGIRSFARGYAGSQINVQSIGVELEGPNDGTPITTAQTKSMVELLRYFRTEYAIPLTRQYYFGHKDVAPGYKTDPQGYSVEYTLKIIADTEPAPTRPNTLGFQLRNEVYKLAQGAYHPEWKFHQFARSEKLGSPIRVGLDFTANGDRYTGEIYGRDIIMSKYNQWDVVIRANTLTDTMVYNTLMEFAYGALGVDYRPDQAFYRFISHEVPRKPVGVPLDDSTRLQAVTGAAYATQLYTFDTLYTPIAAAGSATDWSVVRQLSSILAAQNINAADAALRDVINQTMYARLNTPYNATIPFIKTAHDLKLGAPLAAQREWTFDGQTYLYAVYADDTLYAPKAQPTAIKRLSETAD